MSRKLAENIPHHVNVLRSHIRVYLYTQNIEGHDGVLKCRSKLFSDKFISTSQSERVDAILFPCRWVI
jgi:hypothetical protein